MSMAVHIGVSKGATTPKSKINKKINKLNVKI